MATDPADCLKEWTTSVLKSINHVPSDEFDGVLDLSTKMDDMIF